MSLNPVGDFKELISAPLIAVMNKNEKVEIIIILFIYFIEINHNIFIILYEFYIDSIINIAYYIFILCIFNEDKNLLTKNFNFFINVNLFN